MTAAIGRLVNKADFERLLATRSRSRSAHFALHHVAAPPSPPAKPARLAAKTAAQELSTVTAPVCTQPVDTLLADTSCQVLDTAWIGCVVPKRHAKRAVTRSLLKRQVRSAFQRHVALLPGGLWLVRLRVPFALTEFVSARSAALAAAARDELDALLRRAAA